jgi:hypothetical protein
MDKRQSLIVECLRKNAKVSVRKISKITDIPKSTVFEILYDIRPLVKYVSLFDFSNYIRVFVVCTGYEFLQGCPYVNRISLLAYDNALVEFIFPNEEIRAKWLSRLNLQKVFPVEKVMFQESIFRF